MERPIEEQPIPDQWLVVEFLDTSGVSPDSHLSVRRFPATVREYRQFMDSGGYDDRRLWSERGWQWRAETGFRAPAYWDAPGYERANLPVTGISIWEAEAFAAHAGARLPSEIEWEAMATNGWTSRYPWGDEEDMNGERAHLTFFGQLSPSALRTVDALPAGQSKAGVWDLLGNVSEWCYPGASGEVSNAAATAVLRGGSSWHTPISVDAYFRDEVYAGTRDNQTGIRLVRGDGLRLETSPSVLVREEARATTASRGRLKRPTKPFRQEGIPKGLTESSWSLTISGPVTQPISVSLQDLQQQAPARDHGLFVCVCRWGEVNRFAGVRISDLMANLQLPASYRDLYLLQRSVPGPRGEVYESTIPVRDLIDHDAMLVWEMDGEPLTLETGWPVRLIDLHIYGYKQVKCLGELVFARTLERGWWETTRGYDVDGTVRPGVITVVGASPRRREIDGSGRVPLDRGDLEA